MPRNVESKAVLLRKKYKLVKLTKISDVTPELKID